jgi:hypothetical protein
MDAAVVIASVRQILLDPLGRYWTDADFMFPTLTMALNAIIAVKPDANPITVDFELVAGTRQDIPADGIETLKVTRNVDSGKAVRSYDMDALAEADPEWASADADVDVELVMLDTKRTPTSFWVYPPNDGEGEVELIYAASHAPITNAYGDILLSDIYEPAVVDYMLAQAYAKNTSRGDLAKYQVFMGAFYQKLGVKQQAQTFVRPEVKP